MFFRCKRFLLLSIPTGALLLAQSETATLRGTVTDPAGKPLSEVAVVIRDATLVNPESETLVVSREVTTDAAGRYEASHLKPGLYQVTVEEDGFQAFVARGILLDPGQVRRFDVRLAAKSADEKPVEVHESPSLIQPESGTLSHPIDYKARWNDAPFVDLDPSPLPLLTTAPAVQGNGNRTGLVMSGISSRDQQTWAIDGMPHDTVTETGNPAFFETVEVTIANPNAGASRPVHFNMVSKRGSEGVHGLVYFKRGSSAFNARSFFDAQKISYKLSEVEGELGGPLIRGWTYFFGGGMYQKKPYNQDLFADVPTLQMRALDFSSYLAPETAPNGQVVAVRDPRNGQPFPGNRIPVSRQASVALNCLNNYWPAPNTGDAAAFSQNYTWNHNFGSGPYIGNWPFARVDQKLSSQNQLYLRWMQNQVAFVAPGSVGARLASTRTTRYRSLMASDVHASSFGLVNQLKVGYIRLRAEQGESEASVDPMRGDQVVSTLGLQGVNPNGYSVQGFPSVFVGGLTPLSMVYGGGSDENSAQNDGVLAIEESMAWSRGRHSITAGVEHNRFSWRDAAVPNTVYGRFGFTGEFTGLGFADFALGLPATSTRQNLKVNRLVNQNQTGVFLAGSFRAASRLTLEYGVRWDYYNTPAYDDGFMSNWDPASGNLMVAPGTRTAVSAYFPRSVAVVTGDVTPRAKTTNVRPRLSAAYRLGDNMVLRGGYGEFTENLGYGAGGRLNPTNPYALTETYTNSISGGTTALSFPRPFPTNPAASQLPGVSVTAFPAETAEGVIRQYNLTVERATRGLGLSASYVGSRGAGLNYALDTNKPRAGTTPFAVSRKPYPQFANTYVMRTDGEWHYDSLVLQARKRTGPVTFATSFTWANNISNYANTTNPYNITNQWTRDGSNRRLYWVGSALWPLPAAPRQRWLLSNWTLQAATTFASGQYYSPLFTGPDPANASQGFVTQLPDCIGNPNSGARTLGRWFNPTAFAVPPANAGRYGTCGMNVLEGYPIHVGHLSLAKRIPMGELVRAVFTTQISNITNTPHFTIPNNNISEPNPGMFTSASVLGSSSPERLGYRQVAFKLRVEW